MMHCKFDTKDLLKVLERNVDAMVGVDVDGVAHEVLEEIGATLLADMQAGVITHAKKGRALRAIKSSGAQRVANYHYVEVGAMDIRGADKDGFHIIYQEYGSPGHKTKNGKVCGVFKADPWLRPAVESARKGLRKLVQDTIKKWGASGGRQAA